MGQGTMTTKKVRPWGTELSNMTGGVTATGFHGLHIS